MTALPWLVEVGDEQHGVARYSSRLGSHVAVATGLDKAVAIDDLDPSASPRPRVHVHFTDRLWASTPELAAERFERLAATTAVTVTLHDIPQPSDGAVNQRRRSFCYSRVIAAASGVVCNSRHEAILLAAFSSVEPEVIPLPVDAQPHPGEIGAPDGGIALVGYFYPGKGHLEAVDAVARLRRPGAHVVALGRASDGHEPDLADLITHARAQGVQFTATGFLTDEEMLSRCRSASVPLAAHQHVSASGSLATWIAAGRRPLIPDTRYSREMLELRPGTATLYEPPRLASAIAAALDDPSSTWLDGSVPTGPDSAATARHYLSWWEGVAW